MDIVPYHNHIVVQLLQFLLGHIDGVWRRIKFVRLKAFVGEPDLEVFVIFLRNIRIDIKLKKSQSYSRYSFLVCMGRGRVCGNGSASRD